MKKLILVALLSSSAFSGFFDLDRVDQEITENERLCDVFTDKILQYSESMRDDTFANVTLNSYKNRAVLYCSKAEALRESEKVKAETSLEK